jgi:putative PIN family toxin of toxin-antitoxin system
VKRRIVVDTSTLVSAALRADSKPRLALKKALELSELCLSEGTVSELETVLARPQFAKYGSVETFYACVESIRTDGIMFSVGASDLVAVDPTRRDPKDNLFLALAAVCSANMIVSSDQDLLVLSPWNGIPILSPAQFLSQAEI